MAGATALENGLQVVLFRLAEETYAVDIFRVSEIIRNREITPIPRSQRHVRGLANLRGKTVPIVDLRMTLGLPSGTETDATRIIVLEMGDDNIGMIVDSVTEVLTIQAGGIEETPSSVADAGYVLGVGRHEDRLITLLDVDKALGTDGFAV